MLQSEKCREGILEGEISSLEACVFFVIEVFPDLSDLLCTLEHVLRQYFLSFTL